ncbi:uncharacterized protein LOC126776127 [Nymphalis io]|uniref:uncharacterized protein LOC126776127 n=1 Tax=Inachis io TaxID=171585 RepID=UPI002167FB06|nr:uncharacterized protein LOC126776127 [Nymphalis io]
MLCGAIGLSLIQSDHPPLAAELSSRVAAHASRLQEPKQDARLPIPTAQDLEAVRKIAQVLIMLGEQIIPALINGTGAGNGGTTATEIPNDIVNTD